MFNPALFTKDVWPDVFWPSLAEASYGYVSIGPIKRKETVMSGQQYDYWIIDALDELITSGSAVTNAAGYINTTISNTYAGQKVLVVINNLAYDMETSGRFHAQFVVTVA